MKNLLPYSLFVLIISALPACALSQIEGNRWVTGGSFSLASPNKIKSVTVGMDAFVGRVFLNRFVVGVNPVFLLNRAKLTDNAAGEAHQNLLQLSGYLFERIYLSPKANRLQVFLAGTQGWSMASRNEYQLNGFLVPAYRYQNFRWGAGVGLSVWVTDRISIDGKLGYLSKIKTPKQDNIAPAKFYAAWSVSYWIGKKNSE